MMAKNKAEVSLLDADKPKYHYVGVDALTRATLQQRTTAIRQRMKDAAQCILDIGRDLQYVRDCLEHGQWLDWLRVEFRMSDDTARNFLHVWSRFGTRDISLGNLRCSVIYLLAAPSTPDAAVDEVLEKDRRGEHVSVEDARTTIRQHRQTGIEEPASEESPNPEIFGIWRAADTVTTEEIVEITEEEQERERLQAQQQRRAAWDEDYLQRWQDVARQSDALWSRVEALITGMRAHVPSQYRDTALRTAEQLTRLGQSCQTLSQTIRDRMPEEHS